MSSKLQSVEMYGIVILFWFGFFSDIEKKLGFCSDIVVIYYLCNTWVVNLRQILQPYSAVLNELWLPAFDTTVVNKL